MSHPRIAPSAPPSPRVPTPASPEPLDVDGLLARHFRRDPDPGARSARLRTFQRERGLPETGRLDGETRAALGRLAEAEAYRSRWVSGADTEAPPASPSRTASSLRALAPPSQASVAPLTPLVPGVIGSLAEATPPQRAALARLGVRSDADFRRLGPLTLNARITGEYARLYAAAPELFKWAGMAAYTSAVVGRGLEIAGREVPASAAMRGLAMVSPQARTAVDAASARFVQMLRTGNAAVYLDIAWQHDTYLEGGIDALRQADLPTVVRAAWEAIEIGRQTLERADAESDPERAASLRREAEHAIWVGNRGLLYFEQMETLQGPVYDAFPGLSAALSLTAQLPEDARIDDVRLRSPVPGGPDFSVVVDDPTTDSIASPALRWEWIDEHLIPAYRAMEGSPAMRGDMRAFEAAGAASRRRRR